MLSTILNSAHKMIEFEGIKNEKMLRKSHSRIKTILTLRWDKVFGRIFDILLLIVLMPYRIGVNIRSDEVLQHRKSTN